MGQQRLLAARVGAFNLTQLRVRVVPVNHIQEYQAWIAGLPGHAGQQVEDFFGVTLTGNLPGARVDQVILLIGLDPLHEVLVYGDRNVEVAQVFAVFLRLDKLFNVRMINVQDSHVGAAASTALFHDVSCGVEGANKADRAAGDSAG